MCGDLRGRGDGEFVEYRVRNGLTDWLNGLSGTSAIARVSSWA
ncbi:hypothetical protein [Nocardia sp. NPDC058480]